MAEWISVKERQPEDDLPPSAKQIKVITAVKGKNGYTVRSQLRWKVWYDGYPSGEYRWVWKYAAGDVTHWMHLPEPPKEE